MVGGVSTGFVSRAGGELDTVEVLCRGEAEHLQVVLIRPVLLQLGHQGGGHVPPKCGYSRKLCSENKMLLQNCSCKSPVFALLSLFISQ